MAKVKLSELEKSSAVETPVTAVANRAPGVLSSRAEDMEELGLSGEYTKRDVILPRINVAAKTGKLGDDFAPGSIVLNKELRLVAKEEPLTIIPLFHEKRWQEKKSFDEDLPQIWDTLEAAAEDGFSNEAGAANRCVPLGNWRLLVQAPSGIDPEQLELFPYSADSESYTQCLFTVANTGYNTVSTPIITHVGTSRKPVSANVWELRSFLNEWNGNTWWQPTVKRVMAIPAGELADLVQSLGS